MMFHDPHNTFRAADAFEYVDAYRVAVLQKPEWIRERLASLSARIDRVELQGPIPSYMLAAYRGYEDALAFRETIRIPMVVKIDDTDPTPCEELTPGGYALHR